MKKIIAVLGLAACLFGCEGDVNQELFETGDVKVSRNCESATLTIVEIGGSKYVVAIGYEAVAICPAVNQD